MFVRGDTFTQRDAFYLNLTYEYSRKMHVQFNTVCLNDQL
jgi:hypothetical protein